MLIIIGNTVRLITNLGCSVLICSIFSLKYILIKICHSALLSIKFKPVYCAKCISSLASSTHSYLIPSKRRQTVGKLIEYLGVGFFLLSCGRNGGCNFWESLERVYNTVLLITASFLSYCLTLGGLRNAGIPQSNGVEGKTFRQVNNV